MTGTVSPLYEPAMLLKRAGVIPGHDLTSEAALAKLSYLLALELSTEEVTNQMSISLRGEFTEQTSMVFEHPHGVLSSSITNRTSLSYAISKGNVEVVRDLLKGDVGWLLNGADYSGNTPLVSTFPRESTPRSCRFQAKQNKWTDHFLPAHRLNRVIPGDTPPPPLSRRFGPSPQQRQPHASLPCCKCRTNRLCQAAQAIWSAFARRGAGGCTTTCPGESDGLACGGHIAAV